MHSTLNKSWVPSTVNISLKQERTAIDFNQEQLNEIIWGSKENVHRHRHLMNFAANDPILKNDHFTYELTREEYMEQQYKKMARVYTTKIEEITYKNVFYWVLLIGTVSPPYLIILKAPYRTPPRHV